MKRGFLKLLTPQNIIAFISVICGALFWVYTQNTLPKKVENHEVRLTSVERDLVDSKARQELMLQAIYEMRADVKQLMRDIK